MVPYLQFSQLLIAVRHATKSYNRCARCGSPYHRKGNRTAQDFLDDQDRKVFVHRLGGLLIETRTQSLAWALIPNHFHLLRQTGPVPIATLMRRLIGEDIDIRWHPGRKLSPVKIDPSQLEQILANLCFNARDAISGVGEIIVETKMVAFDDEGRKDHADNMRSNFVMLSVSDDGCGIGTQALDNIFEPFFTTKGVSQGTGLGLATVDGIVKQNNGVIHVHSAPDRGTAFHHLPAATCGCDRRIPAGRKLPQHLREKAKWCCLSRTNRRSGNCASLFKSRFPIKIWP